MIAKEKELAEKDLQAALPALQAAQDAVNSLESKDIVEMKTNRNPLDIIKYILDSVSVFFQGKLANVVIEEKIFNKKDPKPVPFLKDSYEESGRSILNDSKFLFNLLNYEKDCISEETIELLEPYIKQKADWFNVEAAIKASKAAAGILKWSFAIQEYHIKSKIVKPKKIFLAIQEGKYQVAMKELQKAQTELAAIRALLAEL